MTRLEDHEYAKGLEIAPVDPVAAKGYDTLVSLWNELADRHDEQPRELTNEDFGAWKNKVRQHLTQKERNFFDEPFGADVLQSPLRVQTLTLAKIIKIFHGRHGNHVAKENGGLG